MKVITLLVAILGSLAATEYVQGKIDMHGGKDEGSYGGLHTKKQTFTRPNFGRSLLVDVNQSKDKKPSSK